MATRVFLADLRHNYSGMLANDCMPLGVGYMKAVIDRDLPEAEARLFCYPSTSCSPRSKSSRPTSSCSATTCGTSG